MTAMQHDFDISSRTASRGKPPALTLGASMRWAALSNLLPEKLGEVIEIGCGQGAMACRLAPLTDSYTAIEPDEQSYKRARERLSGAATVLNVDDAALPGDAQFDTLCSFEVLEHIEEDEEALTRWAGRVRPGGWIVLSVPAHSKRLGPSDEMVGHFRRYDKGDLATRLERLGFEQIREQQYGFPAGYVLEAIRNAMARRILARGSGPDDFAERTASSGRFFQPEGVVMSALMRVGGALCAAAQQLFPDRGPGLIVVARRQG